MACFFFVCAQSLAGVSASIIMQSSLMASRCRDSGTAQSRYPMALRYRATLWTMGLSAAMVLVVVTRLTPSARDTSALLSPLLDSARLSTSLVFTRSPSYHAHFITIAAKLSIFEFLLVLLLTCVSLIGIM